MGMKVVADIETESLDPSVIWVLAARDLETGDDYLFERPDLNPEPLAEFSKSVSTWVGHNFLCFDRPVINRLVAGCSIHPDSVVDTLVVSRLLHFAIEGGHSLDAWGARLGLAKPDLADFSALTPEMITRVRGDVLLNEKLYRHYQSYIEAEEWQEALRTEHRMALICQEMHENGFYFDRDEAQRLFKEISDRVYRLEQDMQAAFPPRSKLIREVTPKETKHGTLALTDFRWLGESPDLTPYCAGATFSRISFEPFNPGSPKQVVQRLNEAGWKPVEKTKGHIKELRKRHDKDPDRLAYFEEYGWQISETNLGTLPDDAPTAAHRLKEYLTLLSRKRKFEEWFGSFNPSTHRIHGQFMPIGAWTHRMAHSAPNMGNNVALDKEYGPEMRRLWTASPGNILVGVDMASAHLRIFAHLIEDEGYIQEVASGDPHSVNARALDLDPLAVYVDKANQSGRDLSKTFIYSFLNGAAAEKVASILYCDRKEAQARLKSFEERIPGLKELKRKRIPRDAARGYFVGLDGRKVIWGEEHGMLAGYMQNGEAILMKKANILWRDELDQQKIPYWQINFVHDEWQTETIDDKEVAEKIGQIQIQAIEHVGEIYGLRCPLAGTIKIGYTWEVTH